MAKVIDFFVGFKHSSIKNLEEVSRDKNYSISMKSFTILLGLSLTNFISNPITENQAIEITLENITKKKLTGSAIFEDYYKFFTSLNDKNLLRADKNGPALSPYIVFNDIINKIMPEYKETAKQRNSAADYIK